MVLLVIGQLSRGGEGEAERMSVEEERGLLAGGRVEGGDDGGKRSSHV